MTRCPDPPRIRYEFDHCWGARRLAEQGAAGWSIAGVYTTTDGSPVYVLQRPLPESAVGGQG